jgi:hypothetical protein
MAFWGPSRSPSLFCVAHARAVAVALSDDAIWFQFLCVLPPRMIEILWNFSIIGDFSLFLLCFNFFLSDASGLAEVHRDALDMCKYHRFNEIVHSITFLSFILISWNFDILHLWCISYRSLSMMGSVTMDLMKLNFWVHTRKCHVCKVSGRYTKF